MDYRNSTRRRREAAQDHENHWAEWGWLLSTSTVPQSPKRVPLQASDRPPHLRNTTKMGTADRVHCCGPREAVLPYRRVRTVFQRTSRQDYFRSRLQDGRAERSWFTRPFTFIAQHDRSECWCSCLGH